MPGHASQVDCRRLDIVYVFASNESYLRIGSCMSISHNWQGCAIRATQPLHHAMDARDVVVRRAHKLEEALHRVLP